MSDRFDLAIIGAGAAGLSAAYGAARLGWRVALIERGEMGGDCLNYGCVPSKALLHAARRGMSWEAAQAHIGRTITRIAPMDSVARYEGIGCTVLRGTARLIAPGRLSVDGKPLNARRILLAIGSRTRVPDFCAGVPYLTNETIWSLTACPGHLLIIGAGPMGCEMAEAFAGLGAKVTLIGRFLPRTPLELSAPLRAALTAKGVEIIEARAVAAAAGPAITLEAGRVITGSHILLATGRVVETGDLGVAAGPEGIRTDASLNVLGHKNLYAAGDCADPAGIGPQRYTHIAGAHAALLIRRLLFRLPARLPATPPVRVVYTAPEIAEIGATQGATILTQNFDENDRAIADEDTAGLIRLVLDAKGRLIGAGIAAPHAGEMIGLYALAIAERTRLSALAGLVLPYPTLSEAGKRAAGAHFAAKVFSAPTRRLVSFLRLLP